MCLVLGFLYYPPSPMVATPLAPSVHTDRKKSTMLYLSRSCTHHSTHIRRWKQKNYTRHVARPCFHISIIYYIYYAMHVARLRFLYFPFPLNEAIPFRALSHTIRLISVVDKSKKKDYAMLVARPCFLILSNTPPTPHPNPPLPAKK